MGQQPPGKDSVVHRIRGYKPLCRIGAGGMGEVFLSRQEKDAELVVIKTLPLASLLDGDRRALFFDEMRIAKLLRHANIVQLLLTGDIEGCPYLVMEFINGP